MKVSIEKLIKGAYHVLGPLYQDQNGEVLMSTRISDQKKVIIKVSSKSDESSPGTSRTANEYNILKNLDHPGIPTVYEILNDFDTIALVEEYFEGKKLKELIFNESLDIADTLDIAIQLADLLQHIHGNGIIHKNLTTENIIVGSEGTVHLVDFDISSDFRSQVNELMSIDQIEGSLSYISPEQTGRTAYTMGYTSDFYSLGIILYEILAGKPPIDSTDPLEVIHFHLSRSPVSLTAIVPDLPDGMEKIVNKLMAKNPDERYQTAAGLKADLETVRKHFISKTSLVDFLPGEKDILRKYTPRQKLYGREKEMEDILRYFGEINRYQSLLVLVSGYSGVGKSALIRHVKYPIIQQNGRFISGKFDQFKNDIPLYAFIEAIQEFIQTLLTESEEQIEYWRHRILSILGINAGLITEVIPQLSKIIGPQEAVPKLQPAEQEARFHMVLLEFMYAFTSKENPLVIFLDDLQWADLSSLNLIRRIIQNPREENILILGAYRDNEVDKGHPLMITLNQMDPSSSQIKILHLHPLDKETTCQITADSFDMNPDMAPEIGGKVYEKTNGNPFFIHNFLKSLYDKELIKVGEDNEWVWDKEEIEKLGYTDNVIDLMTEGLNNLPAETREMMKCASVLGSTFHMRDLHKIMDDSFAHIATHMTPAIREGYLVSSDKNIRGLILSSVNEDPEKNHNFSDDSSTFSFCHDRVQQAAYGLITPSEKPEMHLKIGRLILQHKDKQQLRSDVFEVLNLLSPGVHLIESDQEKIKVAQLCLIAGHKAKDSTSYSLGVRYLGMGVKLLPENRWEEEYDLTYNTLIELGECYYLQNNPAKAEACFKEILSRAKTNFDKLKVYYLHSSLYLKLGKTSKSLELGLEAMKLYDIRFPSDKRAIKMATFSRLAKYLILFSTKYRHPDSLLTMEDCHDEEIIAVNKFLIDVATSAYQQDKNLMMLVIFEIIRSYFKNGFTDASGWGFSGFSVVVFSSLKLQKRGFDLWDLTIRLHDKTHSPLIKWRLSYTVLGFHNVWRLPLRQSYDRVLETIKACVMNGDQIFTGYTVALNLRYRLAAGDPLDSILSSSENHRELIKNIEVGKGFFESYYQLVKALNGQTSSGKWDDDLFDEGAELKWIEEEANHTVLAIFHSARTISLFYFEQFEEALHASEQTLLYLDNVLGDIIEASYVFYTGMIISAIYESFDEKEKRNRLKHFEKNLRNMKYWAKACPDNFLPHYQLLKAEESVMRNRTDKAMGYYERAIESSLQYQCTYVAAIAHENAAKLCKKTGNHRSFTSYLVDAWDLYNQWGAHIKCKQLEEKHPEILAEKLKIRQTPQKGIGSIQAGKSDLDLRSVVKASQSIASQVRYNDLLKRLMQIIIENAGAAKGCFLKIREDQLYIEALGISGVEDVDILGEVLLQDSDLVPKSFIQYTWRTGESVVVDNAGKDSRFQSDPYVETNHTLSMMCLPISSLGTVKGLLYLENSKLSGVFDKNRTSLLQMLSGQIGISMDNALLYENLEEKVRERTREIERTLKELKTTQTQLVHSEKMASLGELTAGIAHEIQNPLNFVNNFSEVSKELIEELIEERAKKPEDRDPGLEEEILNDVIQNLDKINHHGKRADGIVKGMLHHSRSGSGEKELTDINALCDEYLRLAYHGLRAKDKSFNASMNTDFDDSIPQIRMIPQEMGRVLLNLITNAFYACAERSAALSLSKSRSAVAERSRSAVAEKNRPRDHVPLEKIPGGPREHVPLEDSPDGTRERVPPEEDPYQPTVQVSTKFDKKENKVEIIVSDNGNGIPDKILDKIFQPFFTTKPTGQGTGLGLSMSYDIVTKGHGGELLVDTKEGEGTTFTIKLPKEVTGAGAGDNEEET